ncbi:MAG TPA: NAD(P)H-dependent oxidoreductase [Candidatus Competibacteraceae bacterium]|nr:NAD(P)H-dependent oxidoreductase [Candidatus Competibacteraceae bacterium]
MSERTALVLFAHPDPEHSRVNRVLRDALTDLPGIVVHDLYETYPELHIDVRREQRLLAAADLLVFLHPVYWYSCPAILKEWQDVVLERGFAYGPGGDRLHGKDFWQAVSTGGRAEAYRRDGYNRYTIEEMLRPFEATANICGMRHHPPYVIHNSRHLDGAIVTRHAGELRRRLQGYRQYGAAALRGEG